MICSRCNKPRKPAQIADRPGNRVPLCKICINEASKAYHRRNIWLPALLEQLPKWPDEKVESEIEWLEFRIAAVKAEQKRRSIT